MSKMGKEHTLTYWYRVCDMLKVSDMSFSFSLNVTLSMSKMSKVGQICLGVVMLCMSKTSKMQKEHTQKFLLITTIIFTKFSNSKKVLESPKSQLCKTFFRLKIH